MLFEKGYICKATPDLVTIGGFELLRCEVEFYVRDHTKHLKLPYYVHECGLNLEELGVGTIYYVCVWFAMSNVKGDENALGCWDGKWNGEVFELNESQYSVKWAPNNYRQIKDFNSIVKYQSKEEDFTWLNHL